MAEKFFDMEDNEIEVGTKDEVREMSPIYGSQEWNDWVMNKFEPGELFDGNPTCAGLRRVAEEVLGDIIVSRPSHVFPATCVDGPGRATVVFEVVIDWQGTGKLRTYSEVADVWHGNTDDLFCAHPVATASTRAEGRALRKALKIRCLAAEELTRKKDIESIVKESVAKHGKEVDSEWRGDVSITPAQANFIDTKCKQLDIDVMEFINSGTDFYASIDDVTKETASKMLGVLNSYQNKKKPIPDGIMGYKTNWRSE
jgi:hypothetical protein